MVIREVPTHIDLGRLLTRLFGRRAWGHPEPFGPLEGAPLLYVSYVDPGGQVEAVLVAEIAAAATLAAALLWIPFTRVREAIEGGALDDDLVENFGEVCNVAVTLLNDGSLPNLCVGAVLTEPPPSDSPIATLARRAPGKLELEIGVDGYAGGKLAWFVR